MADDPLDALLTEQVAYYRARAPEYFKGAIEMSPEQSTAARSELLGALDAFAPAGDVLELACGPGTWTTELLRYAGTVTALDASPEMLAIAAGAVRDPRITLVQADLFSWAPASRYDAVFFGFWLSHVPLERFTAFWSTVAACLKPAGRVMFVDDAYRTDDELIEGEESSTVQRRLENGTPYRAVKVPHTPQELERRLAELGWRFEVRPTSGPFFYGVGSRAPSGG
jgi:demethylmenaquinone methyltransferase/2-methoxy-6-polyprenyl-1,4-benzoquinol methylase